MLIYDVLHEDHEQILKLLDERTELDENGPREKRSSLVKEIRDVLIPHSRAEESIFYNSLRGLEGEKTTAMHAYKEHLEAETYLRALQIEDKVNTSWKATAKKLKHTVESHIDHEENVIFATGRQRFTEQESRNMGREFLALKPKIKDEGFTGTTIDLIANLTRLDL